jgi:hypothetical protein
MINKRLIKKIVFLLMASLSLLLVTVTHAAAQQLPYYWDNINVIIDVQTNGDMLYHFFKDVIEIKNVKSKTIR